ncbi:IS1380 family transposase [Lapillicoccus sp.]|uniref:IS1380 family transposase n=1 Tax=Lapillicoccus sp. TaxID=1909287 RepID=UPI0025E23F6A|nr:IS1380 family transposase [Lapillicoccus sp.]
MSADGAGVVAHAGNVATRMLCDQVGLTGALSSAMARRGFTPTHDRGQVLADVAVLIAGGGEAIADINVLRHQGEVLGSVASAPTVWRALKGMTPAVAKRIDAARAKVRAHVWSQLPGGLPASKVADTDLGDVVVLDVDATLVTTHSEKEHAASTFKRGFGYHPLGVWCDNTQESMALMLRPGNAGSNTVADHIAVVTAAIAQVPTTHRRKLLIRADGAGASHGLLDWLTSLDAKRGWTVEYSVGYAVTDKVRDAIAKVPKKAWQPAITAQGEPREHGDVVEITGMLNLKNWPTGMRVIIRREHPHPGAALSLFEDADGWRYQAVATNTPLAKGGQVAFLEARHRAHARVETRIRHAKDTGIGRFPSREYAINQSWLIAASIAADLIAWLRLLALPANLTACEPKALRYRLLHVPARLTHGARKRHLRFPATWPWAKDVLSAFTAIRGLTPLRT